MRGRRRDDAGGVIVEIALAIPALVAIVVALVWVVSLGATYVRALDAAQTAAREVARGGDPGAAAATVDRVLPGGTLRIRPEGDLIAAEVSRAVSIPVPILSGITATVRAEAVAQAEPALPTP